MDYDIVVKSTTAFNDQKPGTSGLRKKTKIFIQENYLENFIQSIISTLTGRIELGGCTIVVGGDGRYYNDKAIKYKILPMLAANGVENAIVGLNGLISTPAASHLIRLFGSDGGILLTASHNPGGLDEDFGVKFNIPNGGPSPEKITTAIFNFSTKITSYKTLKSDLNIDLSIAHKKKFHIKDIEKPFCVSVVDSVKLYCSYMKHIFDFPTISDMITGSDGLPAFKVTADGMNGVMGPYLKFVLSEELKVPSSQMVNCVPLEDFGKKHPDPNLTYGKELVDRMIQFTYDFGCAFDGDGDRNMILGRSAFFVNPSDSLAIVANHLHTIPYFRRKGIRGLARSMPTSSAVDKVATKKALPFHEVPTGWKFFGNLMDTNQLSLCGEESFGMGSNHIREKDGLWAVLAWLSALAFRRAEAKALVSVEEIVQSHWMEFGRNFYTRYDYEAMTVEEGNQIMKQLTSLISQPVTPKTIYQSQNEEYRVIKWDNFEYVDAVDDTVSSNQGIRIILHDGSRVIFRLSGTGSSGATLRIYVDSYEGDRTKVMMSAQQKLLPLLEIAHKICGVLEITKRTEPTVIT